MVHNAAIVRPRREPNSFPRWPVLSSILASWLLVFIPVCLVTLPGATRVAVIGVQVVLLVLVIHSARAQVPGWLVIVTIVLCFPLSIVLTPLTSWRWVLKAVVVALLTLVFLIDILRLLALMGANK
jgi:hypothetical protein